MPQGKTRKVEVFGGQVGPYGDSVLNVARPRSYHSTMHGIASHRGFMPFPVENDVDLAGTGEYMAPIEWQDSDGIPFIIVIGGANVAASVRIDPDGSATQEKLWEEEAKDIQPAYAALAATLHSNGSTVPYIFAAFGSTGTIEYRTAVRTPDDWNEITGEPLLSNGLFSENGNLWTLSQASDDGESNFELRNWPAGISPVTGTALAPVPVGDSSSSITGMGLAGRRYLVVVKPDGIYVYDADTNRFEKLWDLSDNPHPETGKGTKSWGADVYVPLGWGGMVRVTRDLNILPVSPLPPTSSPDSTTPGQSVVRALAGDATHLWAAIKPFWKRVGSKINLSVKTSADDMSSWSDKSSVCTDDDLNTNFALSVIEGANTGIIAVGADERFFAPWFEINGDGESLALGVMDYWRGAAASVGPATDIAFVDANGGADTITQTAAGFGVFSAGDGITISGSADNDGTYTIVSVVAATITLATGTLTAEEAGESVTIIAARWTEVSVVLGYTDAFSRTGPILRAAPMPSDWVKASPSNLGTSRYWVRFRETDDSKVAGATTIREVRVIPEVAALDGNDVTLTGMDDGSTRTHILRGYPVANGFHWDDVISHHGDYSLGLLFSQIKGTGEGRALWIVGPIGASYYQLGTTTLPTSKSYPDATNAFASLLRLPADDRIDGKTRASEVQKGVEYIEIDGRAFANDADEVQAWVSFDGATPVYYGSAKRLPTKLTLPHHDASRGYEYAVTVGLKDAAVGATLPQITRVRAGVYTVEGTPLTV